MTLVVPKVLPTIKSGDKAYPVYIWQTRPELLMIAIYDYLGEGELSLAQAKELTTQILYENVKFRWQTGNDFALNRLYKGVAFFDSKGELKTIKTSKHILHYTP